MTQLVTTAARARRAAHREAASGLTYGSLAVGASALLFAVNVIGARVFSSAEFGLLASLTGVLVLLGVLFTAVQTYIAGCVAAGTIGSLRAVLRRIGPAWWATSAGLVVASGPLALLLRASASDVIAVAASVLALLVYAACLGVLQGRERLVGLATLNLLQAALRVFAVLLGASVGGVTGVLVATAAAIAICAVLAGWRAGRVLRADGVERPEVQSPGFALTLFVTAAIGVPTGADILVVRAVLSAQDAGAWATVAIVGRGVVFFGSLVGVAAYPAFLTRPAESRRALRRALAIVCLAGALGVVVCSVDPGLALVLVAGRIDPLAQRLLLPYLLAAAAAAAVAVLGYRALAAERKSVCAIGFPTIAIAYLAMTALGGWTGPVPAAWLAAVVMWSGLLVTGWMLVRRRGVST